MFVAARHRRTPARWALRSLLACAAAVPVSMAGAPADAALAVELHDATARPLGAVTVIGDSVLQGSLEFGPTLVDRLAEYGWGPIRARAGLGYTADATPVTPEARATFWIDRWRAEGWDAPNVIVNVGANDSGLCDRSVRCARASILRLVDRIGPGHTIWWPMVTRHPLLGHQADTWNTALVQIAAERDEFITWDWPTVMARTGLTTADHTHLTVSGYQTRSHIMARTFSADVGAGARVGDDAPLATAAGPRSEVVLLEPTRALDTRVDPGAPVAAGDAIEVDVSSVVPDAATAVAAYVSATNTTADGFLTAWGCDGDRPLASTVNYRAGATRGAVAVIPLTTDRTFCLSTHASADLLVDVQAAFVPVESGESAALRFSPADTPERLVDTRESGRSRTLELDAPTGAAGVSITVTAVFAAVPGFLTVYPCDDDVPFVATVNYDADELVSGTAYVPVGPEGTFCVFSLTETDVTVDLTGVFAVDGELVFQPTTPTRQLDTREATGGWGPVHNPLDTYDMRVAPAGASAVTGTLTVVDPMHFGFQRAWGCGEMPPTADVTALAGTTLANSVTTGIDPDGRLCVYSHIGADTVFDTTGWWLPADPA